MTEVQVVTLLMPLKMCFEIVSIFYTFLIDAKSIFSQKTKQFLERSPVQDVENSCKGTACTNVNVDPSRNSSFFIEKRKIIQNS